MNPVIGRIQPFGFNFAPRGWAFCDGQLLPISQNSALFSLLGTIYGGDGRTTFALPDLRGRVAIQQGHGPGLSDYRIGQKGGRETVTLNITNLPNHNHSAVGTPKYNAGAPEQDDPAGAVPASSAAFGDLYATTAPTNGLAGSVSVSMGNTGGNQSFDIRKPYLAVNWCIALYGVYPSRS